MNQARATSTSATPAQRGVTQRRPASRRPECRGQRRARPTVACCTPINQPVGERRPSSRATSPTNPPPRLPPTRKVMPDHQARPASVASSQPDGDGLHGRRRAGLCAFAQEPALAPTAPRATRPGTRCHITTRSASAERRDEAPALGRARDDEQHRCGRTEQHAQPGPAHRQADTERDQGEQRRAGGGVQVAEQTEAERTAAHQQGRHGQLLDEQRHSNASAARPSRRPASAHRRSRDRRCG